MFTRILHLTIIIMVSVISTAHGRCIYTLKARITVAVYNTSVNQAERYLDGSGWIVRRMLTTNLLETLHQNVPSLESQLQKLSSILCGGSSYRHLHNPQIPKSTDQSARHATTAVFGRLTKHHPVPDFVYDNTSGQFPSPANDIFSVIMSYCLCCCLYKQFLGTRETSQIAKSNSTNLTFNAQDFLNLAKIYYKPQVIVFIFYIFMISAAIYSVAKSTKSIDAFVTKQVFSSKYFGAKQPFIANLIGYPRKNDLLDSILSTRYLTPPPTNVFVYSAAKQDGAHSSSSVPQALLQQLDAMSAKEFLPYVLNELSLEERESLLMDETQRRKTFLISWPHDGDLSGDQLAKAGFYSLNDHDRVQCVFCRGCLHKWETSDVPMTEHKKSFPFCRFVKGMECGNREYRRQQLTAGDLTNVTTFGPKTSRKSEAGAIDNVSLGISTNRASAPQHGCAATRKNSYRRWPAGKIVSPDNLADAGFYYTGFADNVRCFYCAGCLTDWVKGDDPWVEHARWYPDCLFLIQNKGEAFVDTVQRETPSHKKCDRRTAKQKKAEAKVMTIKSLQQDMKELCLKLGHDAESIAAVCEMKGQPFEHASHMIDALYDYEENQFDAKTNTRATQLSSDSERKEKVEEMDSVDGAEGGDVTTLGCWTCEAKSGGSNKASHVGLPCGHLVYCEDCNAVQLKKSRDTSYKVMCPYKGCKSTLSGTLKMYLG